MHHGIFSLLHDERTGDAFTRMDYWNTSGT